MRKWVNTVYVLSKNSSEWRISLAVKLNSEEDEWSWHLCQFYFPSSQHGAQCVWLARMTDNFFIIYIFIFMEMFDLPKTFNCPPSPPRPTMQSLMKLLAWWSLSVQTQHRVSQELGKNCFFFLNHTFQLSDPNLFVMGKIKMHINVMAFGLMDYTQTPVVKTQDFISMSVLQPLCDVSQGQTQLFSCCYVCHSYAEK